jgi:beta-lactamase class A
MMRIFNLIMIAGIVLTNGLLFAPLLAAAQDVFESLEPCYLNAYTDRDDLIIGAVVLNWETGTGCSQNLNSTFPFASVLKLFIAEVLYRRVAQGFDDFETELTFTEEYWMGGRDDCLTEQLIGEAFTLAYLGNIMVSCSDNAATWMLMDYLGWDVVNAHVQSLGIAGFGEVMPYAEVDRLKLTFIDPAWAEVPRNLSSQFYRQRSVAALVPRYFSQEPRYERDLIRRANALYLDTYSYNTATPHALALYMQKLRNDLLGGDPINSTVARWMFNTMLLTQRLYSTQYMPPNVYVGSKNGFDLGYRAEVNITTRDLSNFLPETLSIVVVRHRDIDSPDLVPYRFTGVVVTDFLLAVAPKIAEVLYPGNGFTYAPIPQSDDRIRELVVNSDPVLYPCFENYLAYDFLDGLQRCWSQIPSTDRTSGDDLFGVGVVLRFLNGADVRFTMVFVLPNGNVRTYQMHRFDRDTTAEAWFEDVSIPGVWRLDVYFNLVPVYTQAFFVG